jgi:hypothetical protein
MKPQMVLTETELFALAVMLSLAAFAAASHDRVLRGQRIFAQSVASMPLHRRVLQAASSNQLQDLSTAGAAAS